MVTATIKTDISRIEKRVSQNGMVYLLLHFKSMNKEDVIVPVFKSQVINWIEEKLSSGMRVDAKCEIRPNKISGVNLILDTIKRGPRDEEEILLATSISGRVVEKEPVRISKNGKPYMVFHVDADDSRSGEMPFPITVGRDSIDYFNKIAVKENVVIGCNISCGYGNTSLFAANVIRGRKVNTGNVTSASVADPASTEPEADKTPEPETPAPAESVDTTDTGSADEYGGAVSDADREFLAAMFGDMPSEG